MANLIKATRLKIQSATPQVYWREIVAVVILLLAIVFFRSERKELLAIVPQITGQQHVAGGSINNNNSMHSVTKRHVCKNFCSRAASFKMAACSIAIFKT